MRVKKKLAAWQSDISDVMLIIENLPKEQLQDVFEDWGIYFLLNIAENLMEAKGFQPLDGDVEHPDEWKSILSVDEKTGHEISRPAQNLDIVRASMLAHHIGILRHYFGKHDPISDVIRLTPLYNDPDLRSRLTEGEIKAIERHSNAVQEFIQQTVTVVEEKGDEGKA